MHAMENFAIQADAWSEVLAAAPETERAKLQRAMGLKMEQLKVRSH
jgi:hypothetical protein